MLINSSSNILFIHLDQRTITIPRGGLEVELPNILYELRKEGLLIGPIFSINGPGSFTNLRISCLCLNMLQDLTGSPFMLYTLDKISLYTYIYKKKIIGSLGLIYIGQQKNGRKLDSETHTLSKVSLHDWDDTYQRIDEYEDNEPLHINDPRKIIRSYHKGNGVITIGGRNHTIDLLAAGFIPVSKILPNYMIEPNIQSNRQ